MTKKSKLDQHQDYIIKSYLEGNSSSDIGKEFNVDKCTVSRFLSKSGVQLRSASETFKLKRDNKLIGNTFGKLTVIKPSDKKSARKDKCWYVCECECGNIKDVCSIQLSTNRVKSCGCIAKESGKQCSRFNGYEDISGQFWGRVKYNADNRYIDFNIDIKDAWDLFEKQNRRCALCGCIIFFDTKDKKGTASLDRIDSTIREYNNNCQWVHKNINQMKWQLPQDEFIEMCRLVTNTARRNKKIIK